MKNNIALLKQEIKNSNQILILTHTAPDGDALGSAAGLKLLLQQLGKQADCLLDGRFPARFPHLKPYFTEQKESDKTYDLIIFVDCAGRDRTGVCYRAPKKTAIIDHHVSNPKDCDINIVDPNAAATTEIIYRLIQEWNLNCNSDIAAAVYTGLLTDTGGFLFQNTTPATHRIAAELIDYPFDKNQIVKVSFLEKTLTYSILYSHLFESLVTYDSLQSVIGFIDYKTYNTHQATTDDTEGLSAALRNISGIECAVLLIEKDSGIIKGSVRTNERYDANLLAQQFGGGGHTRAAGFRTTLPYQNIKETIYEWLSSCQ